MATMNEVNFGADGKVVGTTPATTTAPAEGDWKQFVSGDYYTMVGGDNYIVFVAEPSMEDAVMKDAKGNDLIDPVTRAPQTKRRVVVKIDVYDAAYRTKGSANKIFATASKKVVKALIGIAERHNGKLTGVRARVTRVGTGPETTYTIIDMGNHAGNVEAFI